jgi:hypothetical protein
MARSKKNRKSKKQPLTAPFILTLAITQGAITCAEDCSAEIPEVLFADCNPEINLSQIAKIYIAQPTAADFADWTSPTEWTARLSASAQDTDSIRPLTVIGDKPLPEKSEKTISGNRIVTTDKKHTLNFDIDETNATNHEFVRNGKCMKKVKFWYETIGGLLFGGNSGIQGTFAIDMALSRGEGDIILYPGTIKWTGVDVEERCTSPIA